MRTQAQLRAIRRTRTLDTLSDCTQEGNGASQQGFKVPLPHPWTLSCLRWKRAGDRGGDIFPEACVILPHSGTVQNPVFLYFVKFTLILTRDRETQGKWGPEGSWDPQEAICSKAGNLSIPLLVHPEAHTKVIPLSLLVSPQNHTPPIAECHAHTGS